MTITLIVPDRNVLHRAVSACGVLFFALAAHPPTARADTPAQARQAIQAACDRAAASYGRRDLFGLIAIYSPNFVARNVTGGKSNFRQLQANTASAFAKDYFRTTAHCTVSQVIPQGNQMRAVLHWHYVSRHSPSAASPVYVLTRDYEEHAVWEKGPRGWREIGADMTRDVLDYQR